MAWRAFKVRQAKKVTRTPYMDKRVNSSHVLYQKRCNLGISTLYFVILVLRRPDYGRALGPAANTANAQADGLKRGGRTKAKPKAFYKTDPPYSSRMKFNTGQSENRTSSEFETEKIPVVMKRVSIYK